MKKQDHTWFSLALIFSTIVIVFCAHLLRAEDQKTNDGPTDRPSQAGSEVGLPVSMQTDGTVAVNLDDLINQTEVSSLTQEEVNSTEPTALAAEKGNETDIPDTLRTVEISATESTPNQSLGQSAEFQNVTEAVVTVQEAGTLVENSTVVPNTLDQLTTSSRAVNYSNTEDTISKSTQELVTAKSEDRPEVNSSSTTTTSYKETVNDNDDDNNNITTAFPFVGNTAELSDNNNNTASIDPDWSNETTNSLEATSVANEQTTTTESPITKLEENTTIELQFKGNTSTLSTTALHLPTSTTSEGPVDSTDDETSRLFTQLSGSAKIALASGVAVGLSFLAIVGVITVNQCIGYWSRRGYSNLEQRNEWFGY